MKLSWCYNIVGYLQDHTIYYNRIHFMDILYNKYSTTGKKKKNGKTSRRGQSKSIGNMSRGRWRRGKAKTSKRIKTVGKVRITELDVRGGIRRTRSRKSSRRIRSLKRIVLASASVIIVIINTIRTI